MAVMIAETRANAQRIEAGRLEDFVAQWGWNIIIDIKMDGERGWIAKLGNDMRAWNQHISSYENETHKELFDKFRSKADSFIIEGELCHSEGGIYSYLSSRHSGKDVIFYPFDLLEANGRDLRLLALEERRDIMRDLHIPVVDSYEVDNYNAASAKISEIIKSGHEGVIIKSPKQTYGQGAWLKIKREISIDAVILAIKKTDKYEEGMPRAFKIGLFKGYGNLEPVLRMMATTLKYNIASDWLDIGDVGSGLRDFEKQAIGQVLFSIKTGKEDNDYIYVRPTIVLEIVCDSKSEDNNLINPRIRRIRMDKAPVDCEVKQLELLVTRK